MARGLLATVQKIAREAERDARRRQREAERQYARDHREAPLAHFESVGTCARPKETRS
jgi:hypothetical protein